MTAEKFLINKRIYPELTDSDECNKVYSCMIEFAQYHVEKALEAAKEKVFADRYDENPYESVTYMKSEISKCYPKENIK